MKVTKTRAFVLFASYMTVFTFLTFEILVKAENLVSKLTYTIVYLAVSFSALYLYAQFLEDIENEVYENRDDNS